MNLNIFLFDRALMFAGVPILMIWKGKKIMLISHYRVQRIMFLVRVNVGLATLN